MEGGCDYAYSTPSVDVYNFFNISASATKLCDVVRNLSGDNLV